MKIALVHYHLRPGGVTQVVLHQASALREAGKEVLILSGEAPLHPENWAGIPVAVVPGLHYDRYRPIESTPADQEKREKNLAYSIEETICSRWPGGADIVHIHNPLIRKNSILLGALKILAKQMPLLLQNHDLAEDFRPDVYTVEEYPVNCHYGVINSRDYRFLLEAGLKPEGLHLLPNEVRKINITKGLTQTRYIYPVRGIRRKNIGEILFLSAFTGSASKTTIAITQPPTTEQDLPVYNNWKKIAKELELPVEFEAGLGSSFAGVMGSARAVITTSVKEGFGFSFLEPWTAGIPVTGRRIDYVCRDFEDAGVCMDHLYPALSIPAEYAEPEKLKKKAADALAAVYAAFGLVIPPQLETKLNKVFSRDSYDFGIMDEEIQENIICRAVREKTVRERIKKDNPFLDILADWHFDPNIIEANKKTVLSAYSREAILKTILNTYRKVLSPVTQNISRPKLLELYLEPERLSLTGISPPESALKTP